MDPNSFNPFSVFEEYYRPYWSTFGVVGVRHCIFSVYLGDFFVIAMHCACALTSLSSRIRLQFLSLASVALVVIFSMFAVNKYVLERCCISTLQRLVYQSTLDNCPRLGCS